jgi:uncharacterized protein with ACT and thioredoxin-like domain
MKIDFGAMKIVTETTKNRVYMTAVDPSNDREIVTGSGASVHEAAEWLIKNANRLARSVRASILEMKFLTKEEIDEAVFHDEQRSTAAANANG